MRNRERQPRHLTARNRERQPWQEAPNKSKPLITPQETAFMDEREPEKLACMIKKPFRCLVGMKPTLDDGDAGSFGPSVNYIPPGEGFEALFQEAPPPNMDKQKPWAPLRRKQPPVEEPKIDALIQEVSTLHERNRYLQEDVPVRKSVRPRKNRSFDDHNKEMDVVIRRNRSLEESPPVDLDLLPQRRAQSMLSSLPTESHSDPLDVDSIRDVQKALREVERKLKSAKTDGRRVSRAKVMKALLTVVEQLDDSEEPITGAQDTSPVAAWPPVKLQSKSSSTKSFARSSDKWPQFDKAPHKSVDQGRAETDVDRSVEEGRSATQLNTSIDNMSVKAMVKAECPGWDTMISQFGNPKQLEDGPRTKKEYVSSSSDDDSSDNEVSVEQSYEESGEQSFGESGERSFAESGERSFAESAEESDGESDDSSPPPRKPRQEKSRKAKGTFAHAVSPSMAMPATNLPSSFDFFAIDMSDPGVQDALCDLMWMKPTQVPAIEPAKATTTEPKRPEPVDPTAGSRRVHQGSRRRSPSAEALEKMRQRSMSLFEDEDRTTPTTGTSSDRSSPNPITPTPEKGSERSWWRKPRTKAIKPSSRDTPTVSAEDFDEYAPQPLETRVSITSQDYPDKWKDVLF